MNKFALLAVLALFPSMALAYIGPGAGLGAIAIFVAICVAVLLLVVGFVWYPIKRMLRNKKNAATNDANINS